MYIMRLRKIVIVISLAFLFLGSVVASGISFSCCADRGDTEEVTSTTKVLITGFEPFHIYNVNPAQLIAENLSGQVIEGASIISIIVPVVYDESVDAVIQAIEEYNPSIVISIGVGGKRSIHVEKIGLNVKSSRIPDNEGNLILLRRIDPCGPCMRFSSLPTRSIAGGIREAGIPARQSYYAGTFICNEVLYGVLSYRPFA